MTETGPPRFGFAASDFGFVSDFGFRISRTPGDVSPAGESRMAQRAKVVIADFIVERLDHEQRILGDVAELVALNARHEDDLVGRVEDADALMLYHTLALTERTIGR